MRALVIGDTHAHPDYDHERFGLLGRFAAALAPDIIHQVGDWADMPSLSSYDKGRKSFEGRRVERDLESVKASLDAFHGPITERQEALAKNHKPRWKPRFTMTLGNHENRIVKACEASPELDGLISMASLPFSAYGWEVADYERVLDVEGFSCSHDYPTGSSVNLAKGLLARAGESAIIGHHHRFDVASRTTKSGRKRWAFVPGCWIHPGYDEAWCRKSRPTWDLGVLVLDGLADGDVSQYSWVTMSEVERLVRV